MATVLFGYRNVRITEAKPCPCGDNTIMAESDGGLHVRLVCWCGRKSEGSFDDEAERAAFIAKYKGEE